MLRHRISPSPTPTPTPSPSPSTPQFHASSTASVTTAPPPPSKLPVDFSPPLIAMVVTIATAFVIITYSRLLSRHLLHNYRRYRRWRHRRRRSPPSPSIQSPPYPFDQSFHVLSPYGLDDSVIKTIPLSIHHRKSGYHDCAVCLLEFEEHDYVRTLPICSHAFHVDCIDVWLRSHANCPLCRAGIFRPDSPLFTPLMAARIRPSLDDIIIENALTEIETEIETEVEPLTALVTEIEQIQLEDGFCNRRDFLLKRSYSFGYERNLGSERLTLTASPWRYRRSAASAAAVGGGGGSFWSKRPSPFSSLSKPRVFSFRYYRGMKSPNFFRRRSTSGFFPLSESARRSRLRSGDPEALLSPERYNRR